MRKEALMRFLWGLMPVILILMYFSDRLWLGQLLIHFSDYIAIASIILLVTSFSILQYWQKILYPIMALLVPIFVVYTYAYTPFTDFQISEQVDGRLLNWNLHVKNDHYSEIVDLVEGIDPHIMCAQETDLNKAKILDSIFADSYMYSRSDYFGNSMFSEDSVIAKRIFDINQAGHALMRMTIRISSRAVNVYSVHIPPPLSASDFSLHKSSYTKLAEIIRQDSLPKIVCGDFNSTIYSSFLRDFLADQGLRKVPIHFWQRTWRLWLISLLDMDHILISSEIEAVRLELKGYNGSDHRAIVLNFGCRD